VYALGVIFYELLTGRLPFDGPAHKVQAELIGQEPAAPSSHVPRLPRDLETICLKCLAKEPARRYASAQALADDLGRFLAGEPISARPTPTWERAGKWIRRKPAAAALVASIALIFTGLVAATALLADANQREREARRQALRAQHSAEVNEAEAVREREEASRQGKNAKEVARFLVDLFESADPIGLQGLGFRSGREPGADLSARQLLDLGAKKVRTHLEDQPLVQAAMLDILGHVYRGLGALDKARPMLEEGLAIRKKALGDQHEETATSLQHLAWLCHDEGKYADAESLYRQALAIQRRRLGDEDLATATTMCSLAWLLAHQDQKPSATRLEECEVLLRKVLDIRRKRLPAGHRELVQALVGLAVALDNRHKPDEAKGLLMEAAGVLSQGDSRDVVGGAVIEYISSTRARHARRYAEAEKIHRHVLAKATRLLGEEHLLVGIIMGDLAGLLRQKGDLAGAEQYIRKALNNGRRSVLRGHPLMIHPLVELADAVRSRRNFGEAEQLYREALAIAERFERPNAVQTIRTKLDDLLLERKRHKEIVTSHHPR
jgi:serine/threonine-protein kinase